MSTFVPRLLRRTAFLLCAAAAPAFAQDVKTAALVDEPKGHVDLGVYDGVKEARVL